MKKFTLVASLLCLFSLSVQAGEGSLALTSEPRDAEVYINGELKGNSTPLILRLPEGKHQVEVKKAGKQSVNLEIVIADGAVVSQKVTLLDIEPPQLPTKIYDMLHPMRDVFETTTEFNERRQQLLDTFNQAVQQQDSRYQAGVAYLNKNGYEIENAIFPIRLEWQASWLKEFKLPEKGHIIAVRDDAKQLWVAGEQKPLYVYVEFKGNQLRVSQPILVGLEKEWSVNINKQLPINLQMSWQGDEEPISVAAFNFDISLFASSRGSIINLWEVNTGKKLHTFEGHKYDISSLAFSQDGKTIASGSMDNTIKVWDVSSGKLLHTLKKRLFFGDGHKEYVSSVTFSTNGKMIISGGADNTVKVWQVNKGEVLQTLKGHEDEVTSVAVRRRDDDILMIASGSKDKTIKLWFDGIPLYTFTGHQNSILSLAISPDGKLLASGSRDKTIKLWPTVPCQTPRTLEGHKAEVISLTFSPDGSLLASISASEMKLWEVASGSLLYTIPEVVSKKTENFKSAVVFTPDGRKLALVNELNIIKIWGANPVE